MQYVLLIYQGTTPLPNTPEWDTLPKQEQKAIYADYAALNQDSRITGGPPLGLPENARTVRVDNGTTIATDGPYLDTKGAFGGFMVLDGDRRPRRHTSPRRDVVRRARRPDLVRDEVPRAENRQPAAQPAHHVHDRSRPHLRHAARRVDRGHRCRRRRPRRAVEGRRQR